MSWLGWVGLGRVVVSEEMLDAECVHEERARLKTREQECGSHWLSRPLPSPTLPEQLRKLGPFYLRLRHTAVTKLKTENCQLSTVNCQPSTLNPQPSTLNPQPSTLN
jgi:hypothetical protein